MSKIQPTKPFLLYMYGYPGSGKTYFARQFTDNISAAHLQADKIRLELFKAPRFDKEENAIVNQIMNYMTEEFLNAGISVIYDTNAMRGGQRRLIRDMGVRHHAQPALIWFQIDADTAFYRNVTRDKRRADDKFAAHWDRTTFDTIINHMQNPVKSENYIVVSGKHLFNMQQSSVVSKLRALGVLSSDDASSKVIKPGMVNLVPQAPGRVDMSRRNISIRQ
ncbi:MAG TPA: ATP-binding protein [Candidatus Saccharimonadales bacterium]|nr:ATP-binding protein [Candidatus Saccharimonadales bacterium]